MYITADSISDVTLMLLEGSDYELARQTSKEAVTNNDKNYFGRSSTYATLVVLIHCEWILNRIVSLD